MNEGVSLFSYQRRKTRVVYVGDVGVGGDNPIRVQSMTISDTLDTDAVVQEVVGLVEVGCEIVRITAPTVHHAENLKNIREKLHALKVKVPLVADIHFTPQAALIAADHVQKVRINPGNYADRKLFAVREYTDAEYESELARIEDKFVPLVLKCRQRGVAMRIGTNHGSLSDRIMNRYGDTPMGMVESALEFVRICESQDYHDMILSMKSSNPQVMVQAYRLLAQRMNELGMDYPLHLGVTEAGEGEDGRIKSAIGILTLLEDGIGDTIRVSLTEDSVHEIPVAQAMVKKFNSPHRKSLPSSGEDLETVAWDPYHYSRRPSETVTMGPQSVGGRHEIRVQASVEWKNDASSHAAWEQEIFKLTLQERLPEIISFKIPELDSDEILEAFIGYAEAFKKKFPKIAIGVDLQDDPRFFPQLAPVVHKISVCPSREKTTESWKAQAIEIIRISRQWPVVLEWKLGDESLPSLGAANLVALAQLSRSEGLERWGVCWAGSDGIHENRKWVTLLHQKKIECVIHLSAGEGEHTGLPFLKMSGDLGCLLLDGIGDSMEASREDLTESVHLAYNILQGARQRITKTEFIACPSCGRTLFDLQATTARIKKITSHLKGVKIAIMGCIVNGPGEMADADFGYVGGGLDRIHLYVGKECVEKNIPQEMADQRLVELIKEHGKWVEPPMR